jgi:hypothetical protein
MRIALSLALCMVLTLSVPAFGELLGEVKQPTGTTATIYTNLSNRDLLITIQAFDGWGGGGSVIAIVDADGRTAKMRLPIPERATTMYSVIVKPKESIRFA